MVAEAVAGADSRNAGPAAEYMLEPVTAVALGIIFLGESINLREFLGMVLIFVSVTLVVYRRK